MFTACHVNVAYIFHILLMLLRVTIFNDQTTSPISWKLCFRSSCKKERNKRSFACCHILVGNSIALSDITKGWFTLSVLAHACAHTHTHAQWRKDFSDFWLLGFQDKTRDADYCLSRSGKFKPSTSLNGRKQPGDKASRRWGGVGLWGGLM